VAGGEPSNCSPSQILLLITVNFSRLLRDPKKDRRLGYSFIRSCLKGIVKRHRDFYNFFFLYVSWVSILLNLKNFNIGIVKRQIRISTTIYFSGVSVLLHLKNFTTKQHLKVGVNIVKESKTDYLYKRALNVIALNILCSLSDSLKRRCNLMT
jgi:hypothetical protein